jgi:hypothetical protein
LEVGAVLIERGASLGCEGDEGSGFAAFDPFVHGDISCAFELAQVGGEVAPGESGFVDEECGVGMVDDVELGDQPEACWCVDHRVDASQRVAVPAHWLHKCGVGGDRMASRQCGESDDANDEDDGGDCAESYRVAVVSG